MVIRIGNTADFGTSGLDEGQATCLLSAVSGGLPLVEPGPTSDPVAAGLNSAINRAYHLWVGSQPQLILELWPDDRGLDETDAERRTLRLVEPAGFTSGDEPRRATPEALTAHSAAPPATPNAGGSSPYHYEGPDASSCLGARRGQEGA